MIFRRRAHLANRVSELTATLHDIRTWLVETGADKRRPGYHYGDEAARQVLEGIEAALEVDADDPLLATDTAGVLREV